MIKSGDLKALKHYLNSNPININGVNNANLSLMDIAVSEGKLDIVKSLLKFGADSNHRTRKGATPLLVAAYSANADMIRLLLNHGAKIDMAMPIMEDWDEGVDGFYPIHMAAISKHHAQSAQALEALIEAGADINQPRLKFLETPIIVAIDAGNIQAVETLWRFSQIQNKPLRITGNLKFINFDESPAMANLLKQIFGPEWRQVVLH
ncbi:putative LmrCD-specific DARPin [Magnetofaba australis IT-1]|uniref:Putative LmrCD-specific DARPin n=2 Tax=Magnetofaba TaxID=1472292 RepID=A0A1Y2JZY4_9PROT|nr:putative LmrCD-specific DARPin [Magnetofaba australis IT-1]